MRKIPSGFVIDRFEGRYAFLSNFWPWVHGHPVDKLEISLDGRVYPSVEHAFQAAKTDNWDERVAIQQARSPQAAKKLGRRVRLREGWGRQRLIVMEFLVHQKFMVTPLREKLLTTGDAVLVEGNWWGDTFWGVCDGEGENHLGKILMRVREQLR